jgi:hypothetical protein
MMIGYFDVAIPVDPPQKGRQPKSSAGGAEEFILQMDQDDDLQLQVQELPLRMKVFGLRADGNRDGIVSVAELERAFQDRN